MTSILFLKPLTYRNQFRCNYLRTRKLYVNFFLYFWNRQVDFDYFEKSDDPHSLLDKYLKSLFSQDPSKGNMINGPKHCWNLRESTFIIFIDNCEENWVA